MHQLHVCRHFFYSIHICCLEWGFSFHFLCLVFHTCLLSGKSVFISYVLFSVPVCCLEREFSFLMSCFPYLSVVRKECFYFLCLVFHTCLERVFISYVLFSIPVCCLERVFLFLMSCFPYLSVVWKECFHFLCLVFCTPFSCTGPTWTALALGLLCTQTSSCPTSRTTAPRSRSRSSFPEWWLAPALELLPWLNLAPAGWHFLRVILVCSKNGEMESPCYSHQGRLGVKINK